MVASARFCSSPVSATAVQETLKRFQYESIRNPLSLSLSLPPCFSYPFFHHHFFHRFFPPSLPYLTFSFILHLQNSHVSPAFSHVSRVTGPGSKKPRRISSLMESLSRDDYLFVSLSVMHGNLVFACTGRSKSGNLSSRFLASIERNRRLSFFEDGRKIPDFREAELPRRLLLHSQPRVIRE